MNSIHTAKLLVEKAPFAGRSWFYEFRELNSAFTESSCKKVSLSISKRIAPLTKAWTPELNSEWICRIFMSAKLIMASTLKINSAIHAETVNMRAVIPYLRYYAALDLLRSVCYTLQESEWSEGKLISGMSHSNAIKGTLVHIQRFDKSIADQIEQDVRKLKAERELISYRAPSSGDANISSNSAFLNTCTLLAELAQFNSELIEASIQKYAPPGSFELLWDFVDHLYKIEIDGHIFKDHEDRYRLDYLRRKYPCPTNLLHVMTDGHVEDFFGAWSSETQNTYEFNPDSDWQIIFDIP